MLVVLTALSSITCVVNEDAIKGVVMTVDDRHSPVLRSGRCTLSMYSKTHHIWLRKNLTPRTTESVKPLKVIACGRPG